jgi:hypothetical protein
VCVVARVLHTCCLPTAHWMSMVSLVDIGSGLWPYAHNSTNATFGGWWNDLDLVRIGASESATNCHTRHSSGCGPHPLSRDARIMHHCAISPCVLWGAGCVPTLPTFPFSLRVLSRLVFLPDCVRAACSWRLATAQTLRWVESWTGTTTPPPLPLSAANTSAPSSS